VIEAGRPWPLGAHWTGQGVNFALFSGHAEAVELCLYDETGTEEIARLPLAARTDQVWHGFLPGAAPGLRYGYRVHGPYDPSRGHRFNAHKLLLDPYATEWDRPFRRADPALGHQLGALETESEFDPRDNGAAMVKSVVRGPDGFDWEGDRPPAIPLADSVIYELHVKGFTKLHPAVPEALRGTYLGLAEPAPLTHLKRLGITAVELLPVMGFIDEPLLAPRGLVNYWGYNTLGFFLPDDRYAVEQAGREFKTMVKRLHAAGIEVILDVVYNHTGEGDQAGPILSFRGIDNAGYYRLSGGHFENPTGTGNALDLRRPRVLQLVMDSLRWWATEYRVDGFRFDLASVLARVPSEFGAEAPFLAALRQDPVLARVKLIAEPWDVHGRYTGAFPPGWSEWNDAFRDDVRRFFLPRNVARGALADRLAGSSGLFGHAGRVPQASVNFVTSHDGFSLDDLVTYEHKRNLANGDGNRDGAATDHGWNAGAEGPSDDPVIRARREGLKRSLLAILLLSQGVPMLSMGDELGRSQAGNNNAWCQDGPVSWLDWAAGDQDLAGFIAALVALRRRFAVLRRRDWLDAGNALWFDRHGLELTGSAWHDDGDRVLGLWLRAAAGEAGGDLLIFINGGLEPAPVMVPPGSWRLELATAGEVGQLAPSSVQILALEV
jgi:glycogen debranching enzyme GlgX